MAKLTRKEKKEEERRIIEEMRKAVAEEEQKNAEVDQETEGQAKERGSAYRSDGVTPTVLHCRRCKTEMEKGVCPKCGYKVYIPMDKNKQDKIKLIATGICMAIFLVLFICIQISRS